MPRPRTLLAAAACVAFAALAVSFAEAASNAAQKRPLPGPSRTPKPHGILRLSATGKLLAKPMPTVARAGSADRADRVNRVGEARRRDLTVRCPPETVGLGAWCLSDRTFAPQPYAQAGSACAERGGWLPTTAQLAGAAGLGRVRLSGGEMTGTLITTEPGSTAAGSSGPTKGSRGDPRQEEPDPVPLEPDPLPDTLQVVTLFDRGGLRPGFHGAIPVSRPAPFRCAFAAGRQGRS